VILLPPLLSAIVFHERIVNMNKPPNLKPQTGLVLVASLIMLLLLTIIGVTSMQNITLEEKMAGNMRDRNIAFQAAEAALRDAESDISNNSSAYNRNLTGISNFTADCGESTTGSTLDDGLCYTAGGYGTPIWTTANMTAAPSVAYGSFTGASPITNLSAQPRYIIEGLTSSSPFYYRITVRAQGANPNTVVWLQVVYSI
jgi:type IV pilus assembly protein PilX